MFRKNDQHLQFPLFSSIDSLPEKQLKRLEASWAGTFYRQFFGRIVEETFAVLYSDEPSRPNIPVNVQFGLEMLKAGFGWSDEELYDAFCYNVQVRYALGYRDLSEGHFELRTLYNFRQRLTNHMQETGENLVEKTFEQITDEQIDAFRLSTKKLRMDSTMIASNIRTMSRLQLLVEVVQRVHRMLHPPDQQRYAEAFAPYLKGSSGQYIYHLKGEESAPHIERIGTLMHRLVDELATSYSEDPIYQVLRRVFEEHFVVEEGAPRGKSGKELSASSLQSPDDWEATYRQKRGEDHIGYTANLTETCDPENDLQLIVKVQVESNNTDDAAMLDEVLPELKADIPGVFKKWNGFFQQLSFDNLPELPRVDNQQEKLYLSRFNVYNLYFATRSQKILLEKHFLRAPFKGTVISSNIRPGSMVGVGITLGSIVRTDRMEIETPLPISDAQWVERKKPVKITVSETGQKLSGKVDRFAERR